ncbi:DUF2691 family protein [Jeotgalibacillus haloalkalitolerans]|uniref:DUF2691 family protein n=1 Tax=Jeotgalibacillus haloalkalitolerans TaxID=3104292 RepID=A0ABU5KKB9_9BACL|nr:DUF2691 family protein [Jeotgalibacillus sp. HH7-29]MDZ5711386.1 DUF2691 family protein [Jeotgalibacillus sp. HH7-29]
MIRGISFNIPNKYGKLLADILNPIDLTQFNWHNENEEAYLIVNGQLDHELFSESPKQIEGNELQRRIEDNEHYIIFADLKAFPRGEKAHNIDTYESFLDSNCQMILLIIDCVDVTIYCKDNETLRSLYENARSNQFEDVQYISDVNDGRTRLSVW